jgi:hypothetical protein
MYPLNNFMGGIIFFVIWLLLMLGIIAGWIIFLVAVWRGMKAHESIAESMKELVSHPKK